FHLGTADVSGRIVGAETPVAGGTERTVRVVLDEPIAARAGDRFVLRSASPLTTIGGGIVTDPFSPRRAKPMSRVGLSAQERLELFVAESGIHGIGESTLPVRLGISPGSEHVLVALAKGIVQVGGRLLSAAVLDEAKGRLVELVTAYHAQRPLEAGAPREEMRSRLGLDGLLFDHAVTALVKAKRLEVSGAELSAAGRPTELSPQQRKLTDEMWNLLDAAGHEPPSVAELQNRFGTQTVPLLRHLERHQRVVQVEDSRFYSPRAVRELLQRLEAGMAGKGELAPADLREVLGFSRKFLIPFLEFCDKRGYTARQGNGRVWKGMPRSPVGT
ncbi:MAG: SelB C-terminal domain-containing protein, partial [Gemmatimonadaceae bacterium]